MTVRTVADRAATLDLNRDDYFADTRLLRLDREVAGALGVGARYPIPSHPSNGIMRDALRTTILSIGA